MLRHTHPRRPGRRSRPMTKLLEQAFEALERMPADAEDDIARALLALAADDDELSDVEPEHLEAVLEGMAQAERGDFAAGSVDDIVSAAFRRVERWSCVLHPAPKPIWNASPNICTHTTRGPHAGSRPNSRRLSG